MFFSALDPDELTRRQRQSFAGLARLQALIDAARTADPNLSVGSLAAFLHVVRRMPALAANELSLRAVADGMGVPYTTFIRQLDLLCEGTASVRALNLLEKGVHPKNHRLRQIQLTERGTKLLRRLCRLMEPPGKARKRKLISSRKRRR